MQPHIRPSIVLRCSNDRALQRFGTPIHQQASQLLGILLRILLRSSRKSVGKSHDWPESTNL